MLEAYWAMQLGERVAFHGTLSLLRPKLAIPIHWGTFAPVHRVPDVESPHEFARLAKDVDVRILQPGESLELEQG